MADTIVDSDLIKHAVALAARAPSLHNSQPWNWVAVGPELQLHLDRSRIVRHTDSSARQALISCGAELDHLVTAMAAAGRESLVEYFPNPNDREHLVTIGFRRSEYIPEAVTARANAILRRRTDRLPFLPPGEWDTIEPALHALVDCDSARVDALPAEAHPELAEASRLTDRMRRYDSEYQAELDWWTSPFDLNEGIPPSALNSVAEADRVDLNRTFPASAHAERRQSVGSDQARVVVVSTPDSTQRDALEAGAALSKVLLECTAFGLATCPVSHLTETEGARKIVAGLVGDPGIPQVLVRVGMAPELERVPSPTPRREVSDLLRFAD